MHNLVPIFICAILPMSIVLIVFLTIMNSDNKRAKVLIKAIEANNDIDTDRLAEALQRPRKSSREKLYGRLLRGCIFTLAGIFVLAVGIVNLCMGTNFEADPVTVPLVFGGASLAVGISFLIVYFVTRKQVEDSAEK